MAGSFWVARFDQRHWQVVQVQVLVLVLVLVLMGMSMCIVYKHKHWYKNLYKNWY